MNFDKAPSTNPFTLPAPGFYKFTVVKAEMKQPKAAGKPMYLNLTLSLINAQGVRCGNIFDMITESTDERVLYKANRFIKATGLNLQGDVPLNAIAKMVVNRSGVVEVENREDKNAPNGPVMRAQPRLFGSECFWPESEFATLVGGSVTAGTPDAAQSDVPFDFDAAEAPTKAEY